MNFESLKYFVSIVEAGSISKAAKSLSISHQGLNKSVTVMENELGCKLMSRTQSGVVLTESGKLFLGHCERLLDEYESLQDDLSQLKHSTECLRSTHMHMTVTPGCMFIVMNPMIERFGLHNTTIQEKTTEEAFRLINTTGNVYLVDLYTPLHPLEELEGEFEIIPLVEAKYGIMYRKDPGSDIPKLPRTVTIETVSCLPMGLFYNETTQATYRHMFKDHPLEEILLTTGSRSTLLEGMAAGRFVMPIDSFHWRQVCTDYEEGPGRIVFSEIEGDHTILFCFIYKKTNPPSEGQSEYLKSFAKMFKSTLVEPPSGSLRTM